MWPPEALRWCASSAEEHYEYLTDPHGSQPDRIGKHSMSFMTANEFPFHMRPRPSASQVARSIEDGSFDDERTRQRTGLSIQSWVELGHFPLRTSPTPLPFRPSARLKVPRPRARNRRSPCRNRSCLCRTMNVNRFEGQTREDNVAMRAVFLKSGWVKEAHYREGWPVDGGTPVASVAYAILRRDWENGTLTPVPWDDFTIDRAP